MRDISYQLYSSRNFGPIERTLSMVAELGYTQVEGYAGLYSSDAVVQVLSETLSRTGMTMPTSHFSLDMVRDTPDQVIATARTLGIETIFVPHTSDQDQDAAGWARFGAALADAGKPLQDAGLGFGWHNHDFEFRVLGDADQPLDLILSGSDSLKLEIDLAWVQVAQEDPVAWVNKYADRIAAAHLKDIAPQGTMADEDGWADVGHGVLNWPALVAALNESTVVHLVAEHDNPSDDRRFAKRSLAAIRSMRWADR
ncbi:MAG: sugar phosphate isomerase/epimerase [Pseudomonadota bacterium]